METVDFVVTPLVLLLGAVLHSGLNRRFGRDEQSVLNASFTLHAMSGIAQVLITTKYYAIGDMLQYHADGVMNASLLRDDFGRFAPSVFNAMLRSGEVVPPLTFYGGETSVSMGAFATWIVFVCADSLYGAVAAVSVGAYASKVALYVAVRESFSPALRSRVATGLLLLPSAVYWSCGLLKEPVVMVFLGPLVLGLSWLARGRRRILAAALLAVCGGAIALLKPYILMAMSAAAGAYYLRGRVPTLGQLLLRPVPLAIAAVIAWGGFTVGSRYFAKADAESDTNVFAQQRQNFNAAEGGSSFRLESEGAERTKSSTLSELALAPLALATALFRPLVFEARNAVQLANAIEATALLVLFLQVLRARGGLGVLRVVFDNPVLLFATIYVVALGIGTGLATTNMGSLSRYRAPMMPFFFMLLLVLRTRPGTAPAEEAAAAPAPAPATA